MEVSGVSLCCHLSNKYQGDVSIALWNIILDWQRTFGPTVWTRDLLKRAPLIWISSRPWWSFSNPYSEGVLWVPGYFETHLKKKIVPCPKFGPTSKSDRTQFRLWLKLKQKNSCDVTYFYTHSLSFSLYWHRYTHKPDDDFKKKIY